MFPARINNTPKGINRPGSNFLYFLRTRSQSLLSRAELVPASSSLIFAQFTNVQLFRSFWKHVPHNILTIEISNFLNSETMFYYRNQFIVDFSIENEHDCFHNIRKLIDTIVFIMLHLFFETVVYVAHSLHTHILLEDTSYPRTRSDSDILR